MRLLCWVLCIGLSLSFILVGAPGAWADVADDLSDKFQIPGGSLFRLHINYEGFPTDFAASDHPKLPAKVDPKIVSQIHLLRMSLPNWQGTHSLT
ncbi:MAG: hypothetical protein HY711_07655, partial [Candidatus Melainabacteria bacterium]|nr:hypothetical protein [Candidatus Melainabacteria bacterium]